MVGAIGLAGILGGLYMSLIGQLPTMDDFTRGAAILSTTLLLLGIASWFLIRRLPSSRPLGRTGIFLTRDTARATGYASAARRMDLLSKEGVALTDLRPSGVGLFDDERIDVVSESEWVERGRPIRIVASEGYRHVVRPVKAPESL